MASMASELCTKVMCLRVHQGLTSLELRLAGLHWKAAQWSGGKNLSDTVSSQDAGEEGTGDLDTGRVSVALIITVKLSNE